MISYIFISYFIVLVGCLHSALVHDEGVKYLLKVWLISPLSMPIILIVKFIQW